MTAGAPDPLRLVPLRVYLRAIASGNLFSVDLVAPHSASQAEVFDQAARQADAQLLSSRLDPTGWTLERIELGHERRRAS